jgi:hypothetical protein
MRAAKAAGLIERFPNGRRAKGLPGLSRDPTIRKAQRIIEAAMAEAEKSTAVVAQKPWSEMSRGEKLAAAADKGLGVAMKTLELDVDPADIKLFTLQNNTALSVIAAQIRVEQGPQPVSAAPMRTIELEELARRAEEEIDRAFAEYRVPGTEHQAADAPAVLPSPPVQPQEGASASRDYARPRQDMRDATLDNIISHSRRRGRRPRGPGTHWGA